MVNARRMQESIPSPAIATDPKVMEIPSGSRQQLLAWINEVLHSDYTGIEELHHGDAYCLLNNVLYPGSIPMTRIKWKCRTQQDKLDNWTLLRLDWKRRGIRKVVPYENLVKGKFRDNYEFLQWYKPFFMANYDGHAYDPVAMSSKAKIQAGAITGEAKNNHTAEQRIGSPVEHSELGSTSEGSDDSTVENNGSASSNTSYGGQVDVPISIPSTRAIALSLIGATFVCVSVYVAYQRSARGGGGINNL